ncbi:hypothetical protein VTN77DRAFT_4636 [Rasamsonia byssochlamydoides]|uniref:uncharacterized protein n=1 Tax=Rasamsonia byssochlamydoides TaxID=89139 RepID=UPI00374207F3
MASSVGDFKIAGLAAGFTLGFGFLTVWKAIKQTTAIKRPHRSPYVYLVWGEILANLCIGIVGWLFLEGIIPLGVPVLFSLLFFWVFEIQLLMQIIINRIFVVAEKQDTVIKVKWITAATITAINITVFCIWIPAHLDPPVNQTYVLINKYWDRTSKVLICIVDAALNIWFLRIVKQRLVRYHGLKKYAPLVRFNARLMVVSVSMDVLLIGLMSLKNQLVYVQFHPVTYMVKLNIEMTMAGLITKIARRPGRADHDNNHDNEMVAPYPSSHPRHHHQLSKALSPLDEVEQNEQAEDNANYIRKKTTIHIVTQMENSKYKREKQKLPRTRQVAAAGETQMQKPVPLLKFPQLANNSNNNTLEDDLLALPLRRQNQNGNNGALHGKVVWGEEKVQNGQR